MRSVLNIKILLVVIMSFISSYTVSQPETRIAESVNINDVLNLSQINEAIQENSYITFPTDIGNIEKLWFEANIVPDFYIRKSRNSRLMAVLTPQIIIRMFQEESFPVRTPSYLPQITFYYLLANKDNSRFQKTISLKFVHHSNGQAGSFFLPNGNINLLTGNFATNYLVAGFTLNKKNREFNAWQFFKVSFRYSPQSWSIDELTDRYSNYRLKLDWNFYRLPLRNDRRDGSIPSLSIKGTIEFELDPTKQYSTNYTNKISSRLRISYHPGFTEEVAFFTEAYLGRDYYNIYMNNYISVIRFGLMTDKLKF